ncbi:MAG: hypothetical protein A2Y40_03860 [Candidatus Margulisbacteria bacterium GWF2_35_9]|nr:MAG: hypothetical protein A2Y40_03860 [Candidatus Margulisbacteria bacterium GWF2_35_9]
MYKIISDSILQPLSDNFWESFRVFSPITSTINWRLTQKEHRAEFIFNTIASHLKKAIEEYIDNTQLKEDKERLLNNLVIETDTIKRSVTIKQFLSNGIKEDGSVEPNKNPIKTVITIEGNYIVADRNIVTVLPNIDDNSGKLIGKRLGFGFQKRDEYLRQEVLEEFIPMFMHEQMRDSFKAQLINFQLTANN